MKVMAHRGYSGVYPENTMLSFREAVKVGCDAIEMDVHETRDGRLVVIHDERLDRTTDGSGRVCDHSFAELQQVNAAACYKGKYAPEHIPSFDEYCEWASGESVGHNIEIKTDKIYYHDIERKIWATIERYGLEHKVMFSSFNHISLRKRSAATPSKSARSCSRTASAASPATTASRRASPATTRRSSCSRTKTCATARSTA